MAGDFRVTSYEIQSGVFTGTSYTLVLDQNLETNYFCLITTGGPNETGSAMARVDGDPFGTGQLNTSTNPDEIDFVRFESTAGDWVGMITIVECLANPLTAGFILQDVLVSTLTNPVSTGTQSASFSSTANLSASTVPFGGVRGGGVTVNVATGSNRKEYFAKFDIDIVNDELDISRRVGNTSHVDDTTYTTFLVEWGSDWNIQTVTFDGNAPGHRVGASSDYHIETSSNNFLPRNTWAWASGFADSNNNASGYQSQNYSLALADEYIGSAPVNQIGVQNNYSSYVNAVGTAYIMESSNIAVERLIVDSTTSATGSITNQMPPAVTETYTNVGSVQKTVGERLNFYFSGNSKTSSTTPYASELFFEKIRNTSAATIDWSRGLTGSLDFIVYSVDFAGGGAGDGYTSAVLSQTDYVSNEEGGTSSILSQTDYISNQAGATAGVLVQVDYSPPPEQNLSASVGLQSEVEYDANNLTSSAGAQIEWEGPPVSGDSQVNSVGMISSVTPIDAGNANSVGLSNSVTPSAQGNSDSVGLLTSVTPTTVAQANSIALLNSMTPTAEGHANAIYLQIAITNPQPLSGGDEDIQGESFKKRFNSFYKR